MLVGHLVECDVELWDERTQDLDVGDQLLVHRRHLRASDSSEGQHQDDGDDAEDNRSSAMRPAAPAPQRIEALREALEGDARADFPTDLLPDRERVAEEVDNYAAVECTGAARLVLWSI